MTKGTGDDTPSISALAIADYVGATILPRSYEYVGRALFDRVRTGNQLRARCKGSIPTPYTVSVTLANGRVQTSRCSCPYDDVCKHIGALLLAWQENPESFTTVENLDTALERLDKIQLQMIVKRLARSNPSVETMVMQLANPPKTSVDLKSMRKQVKKLLADAVYLYESEGIYPGDSEYDDYYEYSEDEYEPGETLESALAPYLLLAQSSANSGAIEQALKVFAEIASQIQHVLPDLDYYEPLSDILSECVSGIVGCARSATRSTTRDEALETLLAIHLTDVHDGGRALGAEMLPVLREIAPAAALESHADQLRILLRQDSPRARHEVRVEIESLLGSRLTPKERIDLLRESGERLALVDLLLEQGFVSEALAETRSASSLHVTDYADILVRHGLTDEALALVEKVARTEQGSSGPIEWLYQQAKRANSTEAATRYGRAAFELSPSFGHYQRLRDMLKDSAHWPHEREQMLNALDRRAHAHLLVQIYLLEEEYEGALAALGVVEQFRNPYADFENLRIRVADAIATSHPHEAVALYLSAAIELIEAHGRTNYARAVEHLASVKAIYQATGDTRQWQSTLQAIQSRYANRRALKEEMKRARL